MTPVEPCGPERAADVHRLTQAAFSALHVDPPSGALRETVELVADELAAGGGAIAEIGGRPVACLRWHTADSGDFHVRRLAVDPDLQRQGLGRQLMLWADGEAATRSCPGITVGVRIALPGNLEFFRSLGFEVTAEHRHDGYDAPTWFAMRKPARPPGLDAA